MKKYGLILMVLFILPAVILIPQRGKALYFFAAKEGTRCGTCHLNPTGGMIRTQVGLDYAQNDHSFQENGEESTNKLSFVLGENLQAGSDMRFLYNYKDSTEIPGYQSRSSFFTMQGALYLSANLGKNLALFYNNDFGFAGLGQNRELWGLVRSLPFHSYIKIGRFKVPYGIRLDDHTSFIKDSLGFGTHSQDNGIEIGFTPATLFAHFSLTNGEDHYTPFDRNTYKAASTSGGIITRYFSLGGSYYFNRIAPAFQDRKRAGVFGSFSYSKLILLGEVDYGWNDSLAASTFPSREILAGYAEAMLQLYPKLWLRGKFDYYDPQRGVKDDDIQRVTIGGSTYLYKFLDFGLQYRINLEQAKEKNNELISQVHVFF